MSGRRPRPSASTDRAAVLTKAVRNAAARLGVSNRRLARILGTSEASISRLGRERAIAPSSKEGEIAVLFIRMFRALDSLVGGNEIQAKSWLEAFNRHLDDVPGKRIEDVEGLVDVVRYLDAMRAKN